jgi:quinol monooxygenase YgiN
MSPPDRAADGRRGALIPERMIVAVGDVYAQIPQREAVERAMLGAQEQARAHDGCLSFVFAEALGDPGHFLVVQRWRDQGAMEDHFRSRSFFDYQRAIAPLLVRESELSVHRVEDEVRPVNSSRLDTDHDD